MKRTIIAAALSALALPLLAAPAQAGEFLRQYPTCTNPVLTNVDKSGKRTQTCQSKRTDPWGERRNVLVTRTDLGHLTTYRDTGEGEREVVWKKGRFVTYYI